MNAFILWLEKSELDELTHQLIKNQLKDTEILKSSDLFDYTQKLIEQNNLLMELFLKIKPIKDKDVLNYQLHNKCERIKELVTEYHKGCKTRNPKVPKAEELLNCAACDVTYNEKKYSTKESLDKKYKKQ